MKLLLFTLLFTGMIASSSVNADTLRLLNWEDYLSEDVEALWQLKGHSLDTVLFDNDEKRDAILINAKKHHIDVAVVDETVGSLFGKQGQFIELNEHNIPSLAHIDPFWRDRCGKYAVPYFWGTMGIAYRSDKLSKPPTSWQDLLRPSDDLKGHISMMDDFTDMLAPSLFVQNFSLNTEDPTELKQVFADLKQQAPHILTYDYPITFLANSPKADQLYMAQVYSGDQSSMNAKAGAEDLWKYVVPQEGSLLWVDCLAISSESSNKELALSFVNFLNEPAVAAKNSLQLELATPNQTAKALLPKEFKEDTEIFPEQSILSRSQLYQVLSHENIKLRLRITNAVVNIYESSKTR
jgi:spermidine/putrescine transport system substrate-binding protein